MSGFLKGVLLIGMGAGTTLAAIKYEYEIKQAIREYIGQDERFQKFFKERGSDPIDVDKIQLKRDSATLTDKIEPENQPLVPIWDQMYQQNSMSQPIPMNIWSVYPLAMPPRDPSYQYTHHITQYEYQPRSVLAQALDNAPTKDQTNEMIANNDLAQLMFDAGKFYFGHNSQIIGISAFKDVLAVCDFPHKFYNDVRQCFKSQGAWHLARLLELDSEVQAILSTRRDPQVPNGQLSINMAAPAKKGSIDTEHAQFRDSDTTVYSQQPQALPQSIKLTDQQPIPKKKKQATTTKKKAVFIEEESQQEISNNSESRDVTQLQSESLQNTNQLAENNAAELASDLATGSRQQDTEAEAASEALEGNSDSVFTEMKTKTEEIIEAAKAYATPPEQEPTPFSSL